MWLMIVDDCPSTSLYVKRIVKALGHHSLEYDDPARALEALYSFTPDLVLVDFHMPQMSAPEFIQGFQAACAGKADMPPVLVMTSDLSTESRKLVLEAGGAGILHKPLSSAVLGHEMERYANRNRKIEGTGR